MEKQIVNTEFLESKFFHCLSAWGGGSQKVFCSGGRGNIKRISDNVFCFIVHNLLPTSHDGKTYAKDDVLDGHFKFFVNYKTFEYLVCKHSDYGNLISVIPVEFKDFYTKDTLPEISRKRVESMIADKLLGAYFYNSNAVNSNGANLIDPETPEPAGKNFNENIVRYNGVKSSLITNYRGYVWCNYKVETLSKAELEALKILEGWTPPVLPNFPEDTLKSLVRKLSNKKKDENVVSFQYAGYSLVLKRRNIFVHFIQNGKEHSFLYNQETILTTDKGIYLSSMLIKHSLTKFIRLIPTILANYASENVKPTKLSLDTH